MPSFEFWCSDCEVLTVEIHPYAQRPATVKCSKCELDKANYVMSAPPVMRASYLDGQNKRFQDLKESQKLNREKMAAKTEERKREITKELKKLGTNLAKD